MKPTVYIETSVVSYLVARASSNVVIAGHQAATQEFWSRLDLFVPVVSELVTREAGQGDALASAARLQALEGIPELELVEETRGLAHSLIEEGAVPARCPEDALHIAVAAVHAVSVIVTWNFKHINNPMTSQRIRSVITRHGYECPVLCSPEELLGGLEDE